MRAGGEPPPARRSRCAAGVDDGRVEVEIHDHGGGFDPELRSSPPSGHRPGPPRLERGLGIPLIRLLTDEVEFRPSATGTVVAMTFDARRADADGR